MKPIIVLVCLLSGIPFSGKCQSRDATTTGPVSQSAIKDIMKKVADYQISVFFKPSESNPNRPVSYIRNNWTDATLYVGMVNWAKMAGDTTYFKWLVDLSARMKWQLYKSDYHADYYCVSQLYTELYEKYRQPSMLWSTESHLEWLINHPSSVKLDYLTKNSQDRWSWCDALFMAPTVFARMGKLTGDKKYFEFMDREFWATYDLLYDKQEKLFYRDSRYFNQKEENSQKVFWGRGNGWVIGGLAIIIDHLPENYPSRKKYIQLFQEMMSRISTRQDEAGFWHPSMLDYTAYPMPETSASGFFTYGLAWGINRGYLDKATYLAPTQKAWSALVSAVHDTGKVGWVQAVGADPKKVTKDETEVYGVGAFLLAGSEMYTLSN